MKFIAIGRTNILSESIVRLTESGHEIVMIINCEETQYQYKSAQKSFKRIAKDKGIPLITTNKLELPELIEKIRDSQAEVAISVNWATIIPKNFIDLFRYGIVNAHCGDLPRLRGNSARNWAIISGEKRIALTLHLMDDKLDSGPILLKEYYETTDKTKIGDLYNFVQREAPKLFEKALKGIKGGKIRPKTQPSELKLSLRCYPRLPIDSKIDWNLSAEEIDRIVRASSEPFSGAYSFLDGEKILIWKSSVKKLDYNYYASPGQVVNRDPKCGVSVATGKDILLIQDAETIEHGRINPTQIISTIRTRLGMNYSDEIQSLKKKLSEIDKNSKSFNSLSPLSIDELKSEISKLRIKHIPVVVPASFANHLGVIRGLGKEGVKSITIYHNPESICFFSKYSIPILCENPSENKNNLVELLCEIGKLLPDKGVIFTQGDYGDTYSQLIIDHYDILKDYYIFPFRVNEFFQYNDKKFQLENARAVNIPIPETWYVSDSEEFNIIKHELKFPIIIKARVGKAFYHKFGTQAFSADSLSECTKILTKASQQFPLVIQEKIPGEDDFRTTTMVTLGSCLDSNSRPVGIFTGRKLRNNRKFGSCSLAESYDIPEIVEPGLKFLERIGYYGCSELEFKYDSRDGKYKFMELNARLWKWHSLATACNVNLVYMQYQLAINKHIENPNPKQIFGKKWWLSLMDSWICLKEISRGNMDPQDFFNSLDNNCIDAIFSPDDPMPGIVNLSSLKWLT